MKKEVEDWAKIDKYLTRHEELSNLRQQKMIQRIQSHLIKEADNQGLMGQ